jgi:hypothetical protein
MLEPFDGGVHGCIACALASRQARPLLRLQNPPLSPVLRRREKKGVDDEAKLLNASGQPSRNRELAPKLFVTFVSLPSVKEA